MTKLQQKATSGANDTQLLRIRTQIVRAIDPLEARGLDLHELILHKAHQLND